MTVDSDWAGSNSVSDYTATVWLGSLPSDSATISSNTIVGTFDNSFFASNASLKVEFILDSNDIFSGKYAAGSSSTISVTNADSCSWVGGCDILVSGTNIDTAGNSGDITVTV